MSSPGTKVRKIKPKNCLKIGISRITERSIVSRKSSINKRYFFAFEDLNCSVKSFIPRDNRKTPAKRYVFLIQLTFIGN